MKPSTIYIARHAWAGHFGDPGWPDDSLRELEPDGIDRYTRMVEQLAARGFAPDLVATSPYTRCAQTAAIISRHTPLHPDVVPLEALEPGSDLETLFEWTRASTKKKICWVGHVPDVGVMAAILLGDSQANIRFAKGTITAIRLFSELACGAGELDWHVTAKILGV